MCHPPTLQCGSLLKKKDILVGWQSRYFVVYPGRLEYYVDEHAYRSGQVSEFCVCRFVDTRTTNAGLLAWSVPALR